MAKRFTDTEKWKKQFIKGLSTVNKLFFIYILDDCDHAGIWHVEPEVASARIGEDIDIELAKKEFGSYIHEFDKGEKWFIPDFIVFQYGTLNPQVNAHKSVIDRLKRYKLERVAQQFIQGFINPSQRVMDKDMDKDILYEQKFEKIWERYPKKKGKEKARKHFLAQIKSEEDWLNINKALDHYIQEIDGKDFEFVKHGSTWFNNDWKDDVEFIVTPKKKDPEANIPWLTKEIVEHDKP